MAPVWSAPGGAGLFRWGVLGPVEERARPEAHSVSIGVMGVPHELVERLKASSEARGQW